MLTVLCSFKSMEEKGLLTASYLPGNRKTLHLVPLPQADDAIGQGAAAQSRFLEALNQGVTQEELTLVEQVMQKITQNIRDGGKK